MLEAVKQDVRAFIYASVELKRDKKVVLAAVQQNGRAVYYFSDELRIEMAECWAKCMDCEVKNDL